MDHQEFTDVLDQTIILTGTVRTVILSKHPEVSEFIHLIGIVLQTPDEVRRSVSDERTMLYYCHEADVLGGKWIVVVVKRVEGNFVSTMYATDRIKSGDVVWKK